MKTFVVVTLAMVVVSFGQAAVPSPKGATPETLRAELDRGERAFRRGAYGDAIAVATGLILRDPQNTNAYLLRGQAYEASYQHDKAVADFDAVLRLEPRAASVYQHRGCERFKLGQIAEALGDFDRFLELVPGQRPHHWQRGIALYYADRFEDGRKQFELHQTVNPSDVENAVWHYLCVARSAGLEKAAASLIEIEGDTRVPMMQIYALFRGQGSPREVLAAADVGQPSADELKNRLFYAHLYLGLYYEARGQPKLVEEHMVKAAGPYAQPHYMGDVARVHLQLLQKKAPKK
ncbi:MAG: tetratricopeptide repeat protein [Verrucomicrobiales bacterium]|nr:tetratricopeptide repeat protein [Verrucomicrobiales bacterium]